MKTNDRYDLTFEEWGKVEEIKKKRIKFMNNQSLKWKLIPLEETRVADYKRFQSLDGEGIRCTIYVSGCQFNCKECFNVLAQNKRYGKLYDDELEKLIMSDMSKKNLDGITLCGGEPMINSPRLLNLTNKIKENYPDKTIWSYTGYTFEALMQLEPNDPRSQLLKNIDVLMDGQFITEYRDDVAPPVFRGSDNQRIIDVKKSIENNSVVLFKLNVL